MRKRPSCAGAWVCNSFSRAALADWLDGAGIPFRLPLGALVETYGIKPSGWSEHVQHCELPPQGAFLTGLAHAPVVQLYEFTDLSRPPQEIICYIRQWPGSQVNFEHARGQLEPLFGQGGDYHASNMRGLVWSDGFCQINIAVFPPALQSQELLPNPRHAKIHHSDVECTIRIKPDWDLPFAQGELASLSSCKPLVNAPLNSDSRLIDQTRFADMHAREPGLYASPEHIILHSNPQRVLLIPREALVEVISETLTPAKGAGASVVALKWRRADGTELRTYVVDRPYEEHQKMRDLAGHIAQALDAPLSHAEFADC